MSQEKYDVAIVGAGNAALCAALSAHDQGARVVVLEKAPQSLRGGNTAFTSGGLRMVCHGLEDMKKLVPDLTEKEIATTDFEDYTEERFYDDLGRVTQYRIDPDMAEILVTRSTSTALWMREKGVRFLPKYGNNAIMHEGRYKFFGGLVIEVVGGGQGLAEAEFKAVEKCGIPIRYQTKAISLMGNQSGVKGVRAVVKGSEEEIEIRANAVVLACGGFEANPEWRARYLGKGWDLAKVRGSRFNTGDGLKMALDIGAQPYGHWTGAHACEWDVNAPAYGDYSVGSGFSKHSYPLGIMLNANGVRFLDEAEDFFNFTYAKNGSIILAQPGQIAWQIFDAKVTPQLRPTYRVRQVTKVTANTIEELVGQFDNVNKEQALGTIKEFNAAVAQDIPFNPNVKDGRCTRGLAVPKSNWANTIDTPPFEAYGVTGGITFTFGGVRVTKQAEVMDVEDAPIPGLFAAGEMVGGVFYFNYPGGSGLMNGAVFGRLAGESAAQYAKSRG